MILTGMIAGLGGRQSEVTRNAARRNRSTTLALILWALSAACWCILLSGGAGLIDQGFCGGAADGVAHTLYTLSFASRIIGWPTLLAMQLVMVGAMMAPVLHAPLLALDRKVQQRRSAFVLFVVGYGVIWTLLCIPLRLVAAVASSVTGSAADGALLVVVAGALWRFSPAGDACLRCCLAKPDSEVSGNWLGPLHAGTMQALRCAASSWALMILPFFSASLHVVLMAACGAVLALERGAPGTTYLIGSARRAGFAAGQFQARRRA